MPCHPARARELLSTGRAVVHRHVPCTIRLKDRTRADSEVDGVQLRIDPGSQGAGIALTDEKTETDKRGDAVLVRRGLVTVELRHRGEQIRYSMRQRAGYRRRRRSANLRHRAPRSDNRTRPERWLAPSLRHRVDTTISLARRFCRYAPVTEVHVESVAFDTHSMSAGKQLKGAEYRNGTLAGTDARAFLLAIRGRVCADCGATGVPLNIDHVHPRSRGGSGTISNLVLACVPCNQAKGSNPVAVFLADQPERLAGIRAQTRPPLHDAAAIGELDRENGGRIVRVPARVLIVKATGRGSYARTTPDRFGFPGFNGPGPNSIWCPPVSGRAPGTDVSLYAPGGSTAWPRRRGGSTSPTGTCGCSSAATDTPTTPGRSPSRSLLEKPVEPSRPGSYGVSHHGEEVVRQMYRNRTREVTAG